MRDSSHDRRWAFTLVELLVAMAVVSLMMVFLVTITSQTSKLWSYCRERSNQFAAARMAFGSLTRNVSQATLNAYWDFVDASGNAHTNSSFIPASYRRQSELRFISGGGLAGDAASSPSRPTHSIFFQAPLGFTAAAGFQGLDSLLNTCGYYIEFNSNGSEGLDLKPPFVKSPSRYRFRLMELIQPSESMTLYNYTAANPVLRSQDPNGMKWFQDAMSASPRPPAHVLAENIVALVIIPKLSPAEELGLNPPPPTVGSALSPTYSYDSTADYNGPSAPSAANAAALSPKSQLPPLVQITMVAVEEASFSRYLGTSTSIPGSLRFDGLFTTVGDLTDSSKPGFARDLNTVVEALGSAKIDYRVFTTVVSIKGAKWSRN